MSVSVESAVVAVAIVAATGWLVRRTWVKARERYRSGPCCGEGCGCVKPLIFGAKKPPHSRRAEPPKPGP